jgi:hypothetical protein
MQRDIRKTVGWYGQKERRKKLDGKVRISQLFSPGK